MSFLTCIVVHNRDIGRTGTKYQILYPCGLVILCMCMIMCDVQFLTRLVLLPLAHNTDHYNYINFRFFVQI